MHNEVKEVKKLEKRQLKLLKRNNSQTNEKRKTEMENELRDIASEIKEYIEQLESRITSLSILR